MHPSKHLALTALLAFLLTGSTQVVIYSCALTIAIDLIDHPLYFIFSKEPFARNSRRRLRAGLRETLKYYYNSRKGGIGTIYLHNIPFLFFSVGASLIASWYSPVAALSIFCGMTFHYITDIYEDIALNTNTSFWRRSWNRWF